MDGLRGRILFGLLLVAAAPPAHAVIVFDDPGRNTSEPTGALAGSGWQYEGRLGPFLGTPIAPQYFITAGHVPLPADSTFVFGGVNYHVDRGVASPTDDLTVWHVDSGTFPAYAPLYTKSDEVGQDFVFFGRGPARSDPLTINGQLKGWNWGNDFGQVTSWGRNTVSAAGAHAAWGVVSQDLIFTFDAQAPGQPVGVLPDEGAITGFDSGGGLFIKDTDGVWKLAGINHDYDGDINGNSVGFTLTPGGPILNATVFDQGGLYLYDARTGQSTLVPDTAADRPEASYAVRISANLAFIEAAIAVPEPGGWVLLALGGAALLGARGWAARGGRNSRRFSVDRTPPTGVRF